MIISDNLLFNHDSLGDALRGQLSTVQKEVDAISREQFLANSNEQVLDFIYAKMEVVPLVIYRDRATLSDPKETRITRQGHFDREVQLVGVSVEVSLPYTGESDLWKMQPSTFTFNPPRGDFSPQRGNDHAGVLRFKIEFAQGEFQSETVNQEIERNLKSIEEYLGWIKQNVETHNPQLQNEIRSQVNQRRVRLDAIQSVAKTLNIPIQTRNGAPDPNPLPLQRKMVQPLVSQVNRPDEYTITNEHFEYILKVIRHEGRSYERTPEPFAKHDEEELRDILMSHLNGHYNGLVNGEAFRKTGKTDICIEFENRAAFVAECKLWKGDQKLLDAVNQLLGYLTWRDCKTALVVFNKDVAGFAQVQGKIREIFYHHPNYVRDDTTQENSEWRMVLRSLEDPDRMVTVHMFLFNLFVSKS